MSRSMIIVMWTSDCGITGLMLGTLGSGVLVSRLGSYFSYLGETGAPVLHLRPWSLSAPEETSAPSKAPGGTEQLYHRSSDVGRAEYWNCAGSCLGKPERFCPERGLPIVEFQEELVSFLSCSVRTTLLSPMLRAHAASSSASSAGNFWRQKEKDRHT